MNIFLVRKGPAWYVGQNNFDSISQATNETQKTDGNFYLGDAFELQFLTSLIPSKINPQQAAPMTISNIIPLADVFAIVFPDCVALLSSDSQIATLYENTLREMLSNKTKKKLLQ